MPLLFEKTVRTTVNGRSRTVMLSWNVEHWKCISAKYNAFSEGTMEDVIEQSFLQPWRLCYAVVASKKKTYSTYLLWARYVLLSCSDYFLHFFFCFIPYFCCKEVFCGHTSFPFAGSCCDMAKWQDASASKVWAWINNAVCEWWGLSCIFHFERWLWQNTVYEEQAKAIERDAYKGICLQQSKSFSRAMYTCTL